MDLDASSIYQQIPPHSFPFSSDARLPAAAVSPAAGVFLREAKSVRVNKSHQTLRQMSIDRLTR